MAIPGYPNFFKTRCVSLQNRNGRAAVKYPVSAGYCMAALPPSQRSDTNCAMDRSKEHVEFMGGFCWNGFEGQMKCNLFSCQAIQPMITCIWWEAFADDNQSSTSVPFLEIKSASALQLANKIGYRREKFLWAYPIVPALDRIAWYIIQTFLCPKMNRIQQCSQKGTHKSLWKVHKPPIFRGNVWALPILECHQCHPVLFT